MNYIFLSFVMILDIKANIMALKYVVTKCRYMTFCILWFRQQITYCKEFHIYGIRSFVSHRNLAVKMLSVFK